MYTIGINIDDPNNLKGYVIFGNLFDYQGSFTYVNNIINDMIKKQENIYDHIYKKLKIEKLNSVVFTELLNVIVNVDTFVKINCIKNPFNRKGFLFFL